MQDCDPKLYMYTASGRMDAQNARPDIVSTVAAKQAARGKGTQDGERGASLFYSNLTDACEGDLIYYAP